MRMVKGGVERSGVGRVSRRQQSSWKAAMLDSRVELHVSRRVGLGGERSQQMLVMQ